MELKLFLTPEEEYDKKEKAADIGAQVIFQESECQHHMFLHSFVGDIEFLGDAFLANPFLATQQVYAFLPGWQ